MQSPVSPPAFNASASLLKSNLLPVKTGNNSHPVTCNNCGYINLAVNNYCTNCGYPLKANSDRMALYNYRLFKREQLLKDCESSIAQARGTLYIMSAISLIGVGNLLSNIRVNHLRGSVLLIVSAIYFTLARWTLKKPFTALLISFLMLMSFIAINTWAEVKRMFTTAAGVYLLVIQVVFFYFLFTGVKAAYQADILREEFKV